MGSLYGLDDSFALPLWAQALFLLAAAWVAFKAYRLRQNDKQRQIGPKDPHLEKVRQVSWRRYRREILKRSSPAEPQA